MEQWAPLAASSRITRLPAGSKGSANRASGIVAMSPTEVYVGGSRAGFAYLAAFDGASWHPIEPPMRLAITSMAGLAPGSVWATTSDGELWRKPRGKDWARVDIGPHKARSVSAGNLTDVWVLCDEVVLRSVEAPLVRLPAAPDPACASVWVQLATIQPPEGWGMGTRFQDREDFPKTRAAVAGHEELRGARYFLTTDWRFGAVVGDSETARRLVEVVHAAIPGASQQVVCEVPMVRREVVFDWRTGQVGR
jgi:hypothetical protein